jgi:hypothetical protein
MSEILGVITAFVYALIKLAPVFVDFMKRIHEEENLEARKKLASKIREAVRQASTTGDTSGIENIFNRDSSAANP